MIPLSGKTKLVFVAVSVFGLALILVVNYSSACRLREVTLDDQPVKNWPDRFGVIDSSTNPGQSLDSLAVRLLADTGIYRVDLTWSLPHRLEIKTNRFVPECFVLDDASGRLFGLDDHGRVVPLVQPVENWEHPVFTGITVGRMFRRCRDSRVEVVIRHLSRLQHNHRDFYRLIEEIDFSERFGLTLSLSGLPYRVKVRAETLTEDIDRFARFVTRFCVDLTEATVLDLRFGDVVVCTRRNG